MFKKIYKEFKVLTTYPKNLILLIARFVVAYGFATPALIKINDFAGATKWFASLGIPFPDELAHLVGGIESLGVILLILGLLTRFISLLMSCVMIGAIGFVHISHGFSYSKMGVEVPLLYLMLLLIFTTYGAGKYSLDNLFFEGKK